MQGKAIVRAPWSQDRQTVAVAVGQQGLAPLALLFLVDRADGMDHMASRQVSSAGDDRLPGR